MTAAPALAYTVDPLTGGRLPLTPAPAAADPRAASTAAETEVAAFAADPRHPLFELVRSDMARLIGSGRVRDLQAAYDQAVAARRAKYQAEAASKPD